MTDTRKIFSTDDLIRFASGSAGRLADGSTKFFDPGSMKFFRSRISENVYRHAINGNTETGLFVTSERDTYSGSPRGYTVRKFTVTETMEPDHPIPVIHVSIDKASEFQEYDTLAQAKAAAQRERY